MPFFDPLERQLRSIIQWDTDNEDALFYRWSSNGDEIKNASKLIVGPTQGCIFVYEGKIRAVFDKEGLFNIKTDNIPFITTLKKVMQFFESEHKAEFYFYKKTIIPDQKWGTVASIKYIDPVYDFPVDLVAFGNYSMQIKDPKRFFVSIAGEQQYFGVKDLRKIINARIIHPMSDVFAESKISYNYIDEQREELGDILKEKLDNVFDVLGFHLSDFRIEGTEFDEDTRERIGKIADTKATHFAAKSVGVSYQDMRKLDSLEAASQNEGGAAGVFLGAGAGEVLSPELRKPFQESEVKQSVTQRLQQLKELFNNELITEEEYTGKKQSILDEI